ncbi:MAG: hypothetical protein IT258_11430, partial [Saprospiraceae bacterium]|nr:hypothetical protein [Saprospiraceae bacterium]
MIFSNLASGQNTTSKFSLSWEANYGMVNGNLMNAPVRMGWCWECILTVVEQKPLVGKTYGFGTEIGMGKRSAFNIGLQISELRFQHDFVDLFLIPTPSLAEIQSTEIANHYNGWQLLYKFKLLHGKKIA